MMAIEQAEPSKVPFDNPVDVERAVRIRWAAVQGEALCAITDIIILADTTLHRSSPRRKPMERKLVSFARAHGTGD
jgi:hypothetical protein